MDENIRSPFQIPAAMSHIKGAFTVQFAFGPTRYRRQTLRGGVIGLILSPGDRRSGVRGTV